MPVRHYTNAAEDIAVRFLRACDVNVLSRNDRRFGAEMDIVGRAKAGADLLIFEVKQWQSRDAFPAVSLAQRQFRLFFELRNFSHGFFSKAGRQGLCLDICHKAVFVFMFKFFYSGYLHTR
jgi:Holliday junction resolvase-like predicted endonuclease